MKPGDPRGIAKYVNLALLVPIATFIGFAMGYGLDALFHVTWIRYIFLFVGSLAGFIELLRELNKDT